LAAHGRQPVGHALQAGAVRGSRRVKACPVVRDAELEPYRPYFRIAIAIAIGNPASPIAETTASAAVVSPAQDFPPISVDTRTKTEQPIAVAAVKATHLIYCRNSRLPDR
jgi:hypothetical protein